MHDSRLQGLEWYQADTERSLYTDLREVPARWNGHGETMNCTNLDHQYPIGSNGERPADGTPCFCGKRRWNQDSATYAGPTTPAKPIADRTKLPRKGSCVNVILRMPDGSAAGVHQMAHVIEVDREAQMFRVAEFVNWLEVGDLA